MTPDERTRNPHIARYAELMEMSKHDLALLVGRLEGRVEELEGALRDALMSWKREADFGDGIDESNVETYERGRAALKGTP